MGRLRDIFNEGWLANLFRGALIVAMFGLAVAGNGWSLVKGFDNDLQALRFEASPRSASGTIAYLAIDKKSLDLVGTWPWPRSTYAKVLEQLQANGVSDIFLDIDFSNRSTPDEDAALAEALGNAGGVILPIFQQYRSVDARAEITVTRPIPEFADQAWLAVANVFPDSDGRVRHMTVGETLDFAPVQSAAALLAATPTVIGTIPIDFSIQPSTVPTYSIADLLAGKLTKDRLAGRSVVVGAYATELQDIFSVPVYRTLPGPLLHVLAAETLLQNRVLRHFDQTALQLCLVGALIAGIFASRRRPVLVAVLFTAAAIGIGEFAAFVLQAKAGLVLDTATLWLLFGLGLFMFLIEKIDLANIIIAIANIERHNTRRALKRIVADSADGVVAFDHNLDILEESSSARPLLGRSRRPGKGGNLSELLPSDLLGRVRQTVADYRQTPEIARSRSFDSRIVQNGEARHINVTITLSPAEVWSGASHLADPAFVGSLILRDTTARRLYEDKLEELAHIDSLTGLLNRHAFIEALDRTDGFVHVAVLDLHRFSVLNATLGRDAGDELLKAVADRLRQTEQGALVGRLGSDVFCLAVPTDPDHPHSLLAERLLGLLERPFTFGDRQISTGAHIGLRTRPGPDGAAERWLEEAERALEDAKAAKDGAWRAYDPATALRLSRSRELERHMRQSLERREFFLVYQPKVDLSTGNLIGAEALLRWVHPELGSISPVEFIPIAEASGFITELGEWILGQACREAAGWPQDLAVAVNVSAHQFVSADMLSVVRHALAESGLSPQRLHIEVTESVFIHSTDRLREVLTALRADGITIALDDFGTGYSSLSYLTGFPFDKLKIDQSFVRKMATDQGAQAIVRTVISLAEALNLTVVAEGIETEIEWRLLRGMGCQQGQGYHFGKPQSAEELLALYASQRFRPAAAS